MRERRHDFFRGLQRERYESRAYRNPYARRERKGFSLPWKPIAAVLGVLLVVGVPVWVFASGRLNITKVTLEGNRDIPFNDLSQEIQADMNGRAYLLIPHANRFVFKEDRLRTRLIEKFGLEDAVVTRDDMKVHVTVTERATTFIWKSGQRMFIGDRQGRVMRELTTLERTALETPPVDGSKPLPIFTDVNAVEVLPNAVVMDEDEFSNAMTLAGKLEEIEHPVRAFRVDRLIGAWMSASCDGFDVIFDPRGDPLAQAANVQLVLRERVPDPEALQYIDVRFGDHIYFK